MSEDEYPEVAAITALLKILGPLKDEERANVIDFVFRKLGIQFSGPQRRTRDSGTDSVQALGAPVPARKGVESHSVDIRSFTEEKKPRTASQMVAVVAYYLEHLAAEGERRAPLLLTTFHRILNRQIFRSPKPRLR